MCVCVCLGGWVGGARNLTWSDLHRSVRRVANAVQIRILGQHNAAVAVYLGGLPWEPAVTGQEERAGLPNNAEARHDAVDSGHSDPASFHDRDRHRVARRGALGLDIYLRAWLRAWPDATRLLIQNRKPNQNLYRGKTRERMGEGKSEEGIGGGALNASERKWTTATVVFSSQGMLQYSVLLDETVLGF